MFVRNGTETLGSQTAGVGHVLKNGMRDGSTTVPNVSKVRNLITDNLLEGLPAGLKNSLG